MPCARPRRCRHRPPRDRVPRAPGRRPRGRAGRAPGRHRRVRREAAAGPSQSGLRRGDRPATLQPPRRHSPRDGAAGGGLSGIARVGRSRDAGAGRAGVRPHASRLRAAALSRLPQLRLPHRAAAGWRIRAVRHRDDDADRGARRRGRGRGPDHHVAGHCADRAGDLRARPDVAAAQPPFRRPARAADGQAAVGPRVFGPARPHAWEARIRRCRGGGVRGDPGQHGPDSPVDHAAGAPQRPSDRHRLRSAARWRLDDERRRHQPAGKGRGRGGASRRDAGQHSGQHSARRLCLRPAPAGDDVQSRVHRGHAGRAAGRRRPSRRDHPATRRCRRVRAGPAGRGLRPADGTRYQPPAGAPPAAAERHRGGCADRAAARRRPYQRRDRHHAPHRRGERTAAAGRRHGRDAGQHPARHHAVRRG